MRLIPIAKLLELSKGDAYFKRILEDGPFSVNFSCWEPGKAAPRHRHHEHEVFFFISGEAIFEIGDETQTIPPNTLVFVPPRVMHQLRNEGCAPLYYISFHVPNLTTESE